MVATGSGKIMKIFLCGKCSEKVIEGGTLIFGDNSTFPSNMM